MGSIDICSIDFCTRCTTPFASACLSCSPLRINIGGRVTEREGLVISLSGLLRALY